MREDFAQIGEIATAIINLKQPHLLSPRRGEVEVAADEKTSAAAGRTYPSLLPACKLTKLTVKHIKHTRRAKNHFTRANINKRPNF
jgi:hypothetical protein